MSEEKAVFIPSENTIYPKSNVLISGKYKSSLLENKILAYSLAHADNFDLGQSERETIKSTIRVSELRKAIGANSGSFYQKLSSTARAMTGRTIGMSSMDGKTFDYISVVTRATCQSGIFCIEYNGAVREILTNLQKNYSRLNLAIQLKFKNNYSFRLYEILKQKCFNQKGNTVNRPDIFYVRMELSELKLELGVVNAELDSVKRVLKDKEHPDFDKAVEASPERMFDNWFDFKRKVIDKALKEINEKSDLRVEYETLKQGTGGKVRGIDFTIRQVGIQKSDLEVELTEDEKLDFLIDAREITEKTFTTKELKSIANASDWEIEKIEQAYKLFKKQEDIANPTGWMIAAVKEGYSQSSESLDGKKEDNNKKDNPKVKKKTSRKTTGFDNFDEREYDFVELERILERKTAN